MEEEVEEAGVEEEAEEADEAEDVADWSRKGAAVGVRCADERGRVCWSAEDAAELVVVVGLDHGRRDARAADRAHRAHRAHIGARARDVKVVNGGMVCVSCRCASVEERRCVSFNDCKGIHKAVCKDDVFSAQGRCSKIGLGAAR